MSTSHITRILDRYNANYVNLPYYVYSIINDNYVNLSYYAYIR